MQIHEVSLIVMHLTRICNGYFRDNFALDKLPQSVYTRHKLV
jgi:hypothetical protein